MWLDAVSELTGGQVGMFVAAYAIVADQSDERSIPPNIVSFARHFLI